MTKLVSLRVYPKEVKVAILKELGYETDGEFVLKDGEKHKDKYTEEDVKIDNILILPGSTVVLDNNPLSVTSYLEEYGEIL